MSSRSRTRMFGITVLSVLLIGVVCATVLIVQRMEKDFENTLRQKDMLLGVNRADSTSAWLTGMTSQADRLVAADIFKVFASEVDHLGADASVLLVPATSGEERAESEIAAQLPLMRNLLSEFVIYSDFFSGRVLNRRGETYISTTPVTQPLAPEQLALVKKVLDTGVPIFCPVRTSPQGLMLDMLFPINAPLFEGKEARPVSVLMITKAISSKLGDILVAGPLTERGTVTYLVQRGYASFQDVTPKGDTLRDVQGFTPDDDGHMPFAVRTSLAGQGQVYSYGHKVPRIDWWVVQEREYALTRAPLKNEFHIVYGLAALLGVVILLMGGAAWWWLMGRDQREVANRFRAMNTVIGEQKRLLDGINSTITDPIALTDTRGVFRYVNLAFAKAAGRDAENIVGLDVAAIFGFDTAKRLIASDQRVLMAGENIMIVESLWLQSKRYIYQISKSPLRNDGERQQISGIVSVYRDITQTVEAQERGRRAVQQTIDALIDAIEASDPFLGGHSRIMSKLASMIAKDMHLSERDAQTIEVAANLSQIGKNFVPRELLLKPGQLTDEEKKIVESHVEHTKNLLAQIEFDLPVVDAIYQMNERLDGNGYPQKLRGEQISTEARVLAVANAFAAMARPRSYRASIPVEKVLAILENDNNVYDATVVQALRTVLQTPEGEKLIQLAATSKAHHRDITEAVEAQERGRRAVQQTIDALIGAIEASDPFLGGHSRIMSKLAGMIAKAMQLPEREVQTIEVAANLSQIGKAFVPRELLLKPGRLADEEKKIVESHVEHTKNVLAQIEFDLPVVDAIYQMNENLDGSGYPQKLSAGQISTEARVLAVANAFAAMARPRSYRPSMPVEKVLAILENDNNVYDATVVQALRTVLQTPEGEKLIQLAATSKA